MVRSVVTAAIAALVAAGVAGSAWAQDAYSAQVRSRQILEDSRANLDRQRLERRIDSLQRQQRLQQRIQRLSTERRLNATRSRPTYRSRTLR